MNFEVIKRSHIKRNILISVVVVLMLTAIILTFTKAKYKITESIPLVNGTINYELSDFNLIGAYIQEGDNYIQVNEIPTSGYEFNSEKSYCTVNDENINVTLSYDMETQNLTITPLTTKGTKCYLYFDEKLSAGDTILASGNAPTGQTTDWTNNGQGVTYYYTGANPNNWVQFGGFYWRIIRINGDGTIRMIYQGTSANTTGSGTQIGTSAFNSSYNNNMYVGFKYTSGQVHGTGTNSTVLGASSSSSLNTWYQNNLADEAEYIDGNAGFCGDRTPSTSSSSSNGSGGTGTTKTYYGAYIRLVSNNNPSLQCSDSRDIYTTTDSSTGNKSLTYPIGLLTADEYVLAGSGNSYLDVGTDYWTMSPYSFTSGGYAYVFTVASYGLLGWYGVNPASGVRPVINIRADVSISSGDGSASNPFVIAT